MLRELSYTNILDTFWFAWTKLYAFFSIVLNFSAIRDGYTTSGGKIKGLPKSNQIDNFLLGMEVYQKLFFSGFQ